MSWPEAFASAAQSLALAVCAGGFFWFMVEVTK